MFLALSLWQQGLFFVRLLGYKQTAMMWNVFDITAHGLLTNDPLDPDYIIASTLWHKVL